MGGSGTKLDDIEEMEEKLSRRIREVLRGMKVVELLLRLFSCAEGQDSDVGGI
jgi:hypothetical protein